jgi:beta-glucosidase
MLDYDIRNGRTYMYARAEPLYPFGFGLSYTTFEYTNLSIDQDTLEADGAVGISVDVKNTGTRLGDEVVQLYVRHVNSKVERPRKELKAFGRVTLAPGETRTVALALPTSRLAYWDIGRHSWSVEADEVELQLGSSSADIRLTTTLRVNGSEPSPQAARRPEGRGRP